MTHSNQQSNSTESLYKQLTQNLALKYPGVLYGRIKKHGWPHIVVAQPAFMPGSTDVYHGLFLNLKPDGAHLVKTDSTYATTEIQKEALVLEGLEQRGYVAMFAVGIEAAVAVIKFIHAGGYPMKLTIDMDGHYHVNTALGTLSINEAVRVVRERAGRSRSDVSTRAALDHPRLYMLERGETQSIDTFLQAMMELGYEVTLTKKEKIPDVHLPALR